MTKKQKELVDNVINMYDEEGLKECNQYLKENHLLPIVYETNQENPLQAHVKCYDCGFDDFVDATTQETCPNCGKNISKGYISEIVYNKIIYNKDYMLLLRYVTELHADITDCEIDIHLNDIVKFDAKTNDMLCLTNYMGEWCKRMPKHEYSYSSRKVFTNMTKKDEVECQKLFPGLTKHIPINGGYYHKSETCYDWEDMHYRLYYAYKSAINYKDLVKTIASKKAQESPQIEFPKLDPNDLIDEIPPSTTFDKKQEGLVWVAVCKNCGEKTVLPERYMTITECPHCKRQVVSNTQSGYALKTDLEEDGNLLITLYQYKEELDFKDGDYQYEIKSLETECAIYATEKSIYFYKDERGPKIATCNDINHSFRYISGGYSYIQIRFIGGVQKVVDDYKNSVLKKTGYIEFCENSSGVKSSGDLETFAKELVGSVNYFAVYNSCKSLEQLAKSGMTNLIKDIIKKVTCPRFIRKKETTPHKILGLTKAQFKELRQADVYQPEFESYKRILEADPNALYNDCTRFLHTYNNEVDTVIEILNLNIPKINMKEIEKYVESLDQYQCMDWSTGLREWRDYLNMCIALKCDMNERTVIFTNSLKLEHDRTIRKYNTLKDKKAIENFQDAVKRYQYLEWDSEDFDFMVVTPKTQEELYEEGRILHHCVGSYAKSVAEGRSTIVFIRRKDNPTIPLCTVEVSNNRLVQARTKYNNHAYSVPGVKKFMQAWGKEKKITLTIR